MVGSASALPSNFHFPNPIFGVGPGKTHLITAAAALRLGDFLCRRLHLASAIRTSLKKIYPLGYVHKLKNAWDEKAIELAKLNFLQWQSDAVSSACINLCFFSGDEIKNESSGYRKSYSRTSRRPFSDGRGLTNVLLAINVLVYITQVATQGKLLFWGAKINSLIDKGQLWRLFTCSFLHANIGHLLVNCYSLNSIGPAIEKTSGHKRYIAVYLSSAVASSAVSYWLCKAPAVGASGAIFGLVGSFAVFILRHRGMVKGTEGDLQYIARVIVLNMTIGLLSKGIDNWGHLGGLVGGAAVSWFLGPAWKLESISSDGQRVFADKAPIFSLIKTRRNM